MQWSLALALGAVLGAVRAAEVPQVPEHGTNVTTNATIPANEPHWGRIYLRHGVSPIQYFRDSFAGPMVRQELEFVFPSEDSDAWGCALLSASDQERLEQLNGTAALVLERGECTFEQKSRNAQAMGAGVLVIISTNDDVAGPVALVDEGEIDMPSVMIRRSGGEMLRAAARRERLFGRLMPMFCERKPYKCVPQEADEKAYIENAAMRSGHVLANATNETLGSFLAASFGGVVPSQPLEVAEDLDPMDACTQIWTNDASALRDRVALVTATASCSMLDQVLNVQAAGARMALIVDTNNTLMHPTVELNWHGYNVTIASATISPDTFETLRALRDDGTRTGEERRVGFRAQNEIARSWDEIRRLSSRLAWPKRSTRREKLVKKMLRMAWVDNASVDAIKHAFLNHGGGSPKTWEKIRDDVLGDKQQMNIPVGDNHDEL